ncbi:MAG: class I SAM-dependent methyltransferase [Gracilibacteraceae bacterium]|jgi:tRNA (adenine22-N1)-methyltransferase|nr:class I SAM-dependent methyltransferase [Gracilibacteraceae bacterium]
MPEQAVKLGPRLAAVAAHVPDGAFLGDIGTDHALLPIYLVLRGVIPSAIGTDIRGGPLDAGRRNIARRGLSGRIALRQGDGLAPFRGGEADAVTVAGMGGGLMLEILDPRREALAGARTLILQPQGGESGLRRALLARNWRLAAEELTEEKGRIYTVMRWERGAATDQPGTPSAAAADGGCADAAVRRFPEVWAEYGPLLPAAGGPLFRRVLQAERGRMRRAAAALGSATGAAARERLGELRRRAEIWEEMESWLYPSD